MSEEITLNKRQRKAFAAMGRTFRGGIDENAKRFKLVGKAYDAMPREQNGHFDISSARHLAGPLRALLDPLVRFVFIIGAVQVLKSVVGDIWIPYLLEHDLRNILVLFETDPKALIYCDTRFMDTIKQHPVLSKMLGEVNRHDVTKTEIKVAGAKFLVGGLNDSNVSSLSWPRIWISEAWQHGSDGLLRKAIKRADRFPNDKKILIESQAGLADEDLHVEARTAHQVPLTWACPHCGGRQTWECDSEYGQLRPDDFEPKTNYEKEKSGNNNGEGGNGDDVSGPLGCAGGGTQSPKPGTFSGMAFHAEGTIDERARSATWECYHCGEKIKDTRANRQSIMDSYEQDYQITAPNGDRISPKSVCFILPKESARDNTFEDGVKAYLSAKESEKSGNKTPLQDWYLQERAVFYSEKLGQAKVSVITANIAADNSEERCRVFSVDCQQGEVEQMTGHFWYEARAIDKGPKEIPQLARGYAESWKEWIDIYKALKIPTSNVMIDCGNYLNEILDMAAANYEVVDNPDPKTRRRYPKIIETWMLLRGNGTRKSFPHDGHIYRSFSKPSYYPRQITLPEEKDKDGKIVRPKQQIMLNIKVCEWSNLSVKDHLHNLLTGGPNVPKFTALSREQLSLKVQQKETGDCAYQKQMQNEYRTNVKGINKWLESTPNVHYRDTGCQCLVAFDMGGYMGLPAAEEGVKPV